MELVNILGILCTLSSFLFNLVGIHICYGIVKKRDTGDQSPFTFITYLVANAMWLKYAIIQSLPVVIATSAYGSTLNTIYILIFYRYSSKRSQFHKFLFIGAVLLALPFMYSQYQTEAALAISHLGLYCLFLTVVTYGAPLVSLVDVVNTNSTESLSFTLILANFLVALLWIWYGSVINDIYVQTSNILGAALAMIQLSLFVIYPQSAVSQVITRELAFVV